MRKRSSIQILMSVLALGAALASPPAFATVVATGTLTAECDVNQTGLCCGTVAFDNASFDVFGTPVNLGSSVGSVITTDTFVPDFNPVTAGGTFSGSFSSYPSAGLLSFDAAGNFLCSGANPNCVPPVSFIGSLSNIAGSVGLPAGLTYSEDGTAQYTTTTAPSTSGCPFALANVIVGPYSINAFQPVTTPPGTDVNNSVSTTFFDSSTGTEVTVTSDITYSNVITGGETTITTVSNASGAIESKFAVDVASCSVSAQACASNGDCPSGETCDGYHAVFFDISTTATFSGPVAICGHYPDEEPSPVGGDGIVDGTSVEETKLRILHRPTPGGDFEDVTTSRDTVANVVCGEVTSFSPFVIAVSSPCANTGGDFSGKPKLIVKNINTDSTAGNDGLALKGEFTLPVTASFAALDPTTNGAQVVLTNASNVDKVTINLPGGSYAGNGTAGWKANGSGTTWTYLDKTASPVNGIFKMIIKDRNNKAPRQVQVLVKGKNGSYPIVSGDVPVQAAVVLGGAAAVAAGECGQSAFGANNCAFNGTGNKLVCKP